jgi:hypothetical protein
MSSGTFLIVFLIIVGCGAFVAWQTRSKGRWGLGTLRANCPRCGTPLPVIRKPASLEQAAWGGWTCPKCGCKVDKFGKEQA